MSKLTEKRKVRKCMRNTYAHKDTYSQKFIKKTQYWKTQYTAKDQWVYKKHPLKKNMRQKNLQIQLDFFYCPSTAGLCNQ